MYRTLTAASLTGILCFWSSRGAIPFDEPTKAVEEGVQAAAGEAGGEDTRRLVSGRVVLLPDALEQRGLQAAAEMAEQAVLETDDGQIIPLLADWRGRAFFQDVRLRDRKVELVVTQRPGLPYLQVLMVFTFNGEGERQYTDYWCDVCSIPMYEIKPCECCQGDIRLRFQDKELPDYLRNSAGDE